MSGTGSGFYSRKESTALEKAVKTGAITKDEYSLLVQYLAEMTARYQLSEARKLKLIATLLGWKKNHLIEIEYQDLTIGDLYMAINLLGKTKNQNGRDFSQNTKHDYIVILKRFLIWLVKNKKNLNLDELSLRDIKNPAQNNDTTHPDEILKPEEIVAMISSRKFPRDRALIAMQYEAATRIGELGMLKWRDIIWDEYGAKLRIVDTKTQKVRMARLTKSISSRYIAAWRDDYPGTPEGDAYVFCSERGEFLTYWGILRIFKEAAASVGIERKRITHLFRKSRGTHLIEQGLPTANVVELMWANQNTKQIRTYIRMSPVEQDRVMLKHAGVITEDESKQQERRITGRVCPNCHYQNSPTARYCQACGRALDDQARQKNEVLREMLADPEMLQEMFREFAKSKNLVQ
jgi:site-specific recombinase XerD